MLLIVGFLIRNPTILSKISNIFIRTSLLSTIFILLDVEINLNIVIFCFYVSYNIDKIPVNDFETNFYIFALLLLIFCYNFFNFCELFSGFPTNISTNPSTTVSFLRTIKEFYTITEEEYQYYISSWESSRNIVYAKTKGMRLNGNGSEDMDYQEQVSPPPSPMEVDGEPEDSDMEWESQEIPQPVSPNNTEGINSPCPTDFNANSPVNLGNSPQISEVARLEDPILRPQARVLQRGSSRDIITRQNIETTLVLQSENSAFQRGNHSPRVTSPVTSQTSSPLPISSVPEVGNIRDVDAECDEEVARLF